MLERLQHSTAPCYPQADNLLSKYSTGIKQTVNAAIKLCGHLRDVARFLETAEQTRSTLIRTMKKLAFAILVLSRVSSRCWYGSVTLHSALTSSSAEYSAKYRRLLSQATGLKLWL